MILAIIFIIQSFPTVPMEVRGAYLSPYSAINRAEEIISRTDINTLVIDVKDFSGKVFIPFDHPSSVPVITEDFLKELKNKGVYLIARITAFQDPFFSNIHPELALKNSDESLWEDNLGLSWTDPSSKEVWNYYIDIAKSSFELGFDEVNFDYIRFPDEVSYDIVYPLWDGESKRETMNEFYAYLRENIEGKISASIFGLTTVVKDDMGIGQMIEDVLEHFDYVCPMVYPSHYGTGFLEKENPADYPYEIVYYSIKKAAERTDKEEKIRPWLQDFNLRAVYDIEKIDLQIEATRDVLKKDYNGYLLWNPSNVYTKHYTK